MLRAGGFTLCPVLGSNSYTLLLIIFCWPHLPPLHLVSLSQCFSLSTSQQLASVLFNTEPPICVHNSNGNFWYWATKQLPHQEKLLYIKLTGDRRNACGTKEKVKIKVTYHLYYDWSLILLLWLVVIIVWKTICEEEAWRRFKSTCQPTVIEPTAVSTVELILRATMSWSPSHFKGLMDEHIYSTRLST